MAKVKLAELAWLKKHWKGNFQSKKTHCPRGHPYDKENTYYSHNGHSRHCKRCMIDRIQERRLDKRRMAERGELPHW